MIIDAGGNLTDAKIIDLSSTGARIEVGWKIRLPNRFKLKIVRDKQEFFAEIVWRKGYEAGLRFVAADETPAPYVIASVPATQSPKVADLRKMFKIQAR